jgi:hypothetical protein
MLASFNRSTAKKFFSPNLKLNTSCASFSNLSTSPKGLRLLTNIPSFKIIETAITKGKDLVMSDEMTVEDVEEFDDCPFLPVIGNKMVTEN